jgi:hypothetical protein
MRTPIQPRSMLDPTEQNSNCDGDKETATMPLKVFIYSKDTRNPSVPKNVRHVKLHPSVKEIRDYAFAERWSLVEVEFSEGLERIGGAAFHSCQNLKHINKLPSTLREIGKAAFHNCRNLDSIEFPEGLQVIGGNASRGTASDWWKCISALPWTEENQDSISTRSDQSRGVCLLHQFDLC